jgi:DNA-3-methyladenine glycosylase
MKLEESFYLREDVTLIARELLGKYIFTRVKGKITAGMIVETEAYSYRERGSHAFHGKTDRNQVMFKAGGVSYVYVCYGIHNLFNVVTNVRDRADAVLIRALEPKIGEEHMLRRMNVSSMKRITSGPGKLTKAMDINRSYNGKYLWSDKIWLEEGITVSKSKIKAGKRIGIDYAGKDAFLPWRFTIKDNPWVSKP